MCETLKPDVKRAQDEDGLSVVTVDMLTQIVLSPRGPIRSGHKQACGLYEAFADGEVDLQLRFVNRDLAYAHLTAIVRPAPRIPRRVVTSLWSQFRDSRFADEDFYDSEEQHQRLLRLVRAYVRQIPKRIEAALTFAGQREFKMAPLTKMDRQMASNSGLRRLQSCDKEIDLAWT